MKKICLEYSDMMVNLPSIDFFLDKIENNESFQFLRANHGIFDIIYNGYRTDNVFNYNEFKYDLNAKNYNKISQLVFTNSNKEYHRVFSHWHNDNKKLIDKFEIFLKVFNEYNDISDKFEIGVSLGVGLNLFWGVWHKEHHLQIGRTDVFKSFYESRYYDYHYSGVLKYFSVTGEIFQLFDTINKNDYNVVIVGPDYMRLYEGVLDIRNFNHINIPTSGAIDFVDGYIEQIKNIAKFKKTIVFYSIGHILTFYMAYHLKDENIIGIDIGRSFDILLKDKLTTEPTLTECWINLNKEDLKGHINRVRNG